MAIIPDLKRERAGSADLLKGLAVVFMIQVHIMEQFAMPDVFNSSAGKLSLFLGGPPCAPVFMSVMGYFLAASSRPGYYFICRGIVLFFGGLVLNVLRSGNLLIHILKQESNLDPFPFIFGVDILQLAGLAIILSGVLKLIFKKNYLLFFITALVFASAGSYWPIPGTGNPVLTYLTAFLWGTTEWSYFPLFPWYSYILLGFAFRYFEFRYNSLIKNPGITKYFLLVPSLLGLLITFPWAMKLSHQLYGTDGYYHHGILFFIWNVFFIGIYALALNELEKISGDQATLRLLKWVGSNVTVVYIIQWIIIGNIATEIYQTQGFFQYLFWFFAVTAISLLLTWLYKRLKSYKSLL